MTPEGVVCGVLAGLAMVLARDRGPRLARARLRRLREPGGQRPSAAPGVVAVTGVLLLGLVLLGGGTAVLGLAGFGAVLWLRAGRDARRRRRESALAAAALPQAADLLAACLESGAPPVEALDLVADAVGGLLGARLRTTAAALHLGAEVVEAWRVTGPDDPMAPLARAFSRAATSGSPLAETVALVAEERRRRHRWAAEEAARRAGVLAVGPLVVCFLPAFVLLGVVPLVVGVAADVLGGLG